MWPWEKLTKLAVKDDFKMRWERRVPREREREAGRGRNATMENRCRPGASILSTLDLKCECPTQDPYIR